MKNFCLYFFLLLFPINAISANTFLFMSYNVEQLYDNIDDENIQDERFLTTANPPYTDQMVNDKINNLATVILSTSDNSYFGQGPDVISLVEVENLSILKKLASVLNSRLASKPHYSAVFYSGDDISGINPGFLTKFPIISSKAHKAHKKNKIWYLPSHSSYEQTPVYTVTRSILEVNLRIESHAVTFFANHWPAGQDSLDILRQYECGKFLNQLIRDKLTENPSSDIIVSGDFNSQPEDAALIAGLNVDELLSTVFSSTPENPSLYGTSYDIYNKSGVKKIFFDTMKKFETIKKTTNSWNTSILDTISKYYLNPALAQETIDRFILNNNTFNYKNFSTFQNTLLDNVFAKRGTFFYWTDRQWSNLDSVLLTKTLFDSNSIDYIKNSYTIVRHEYMTFDNGKPLAFHKCKRPPEGGACMTKEDGTIIHQAGYSDHFPVTASFKIFHN